MRRCAGRCSLSEMAKETYMYLKEPVRAILINRPYITVRPLYRSVTWQKQWRSMARVVQSIELKLWGFRSAECGFKSLSWHLCPWARYFTVIALFSRWDIQPSVPCARIGSACQRTQNIHSREYIVLVRGVSVCLSKNLDTQFFNFQQNFDTLYQIPANNVFFSKRNLSSK